MRLLGIETSCDDTAAAVVEDGKRILSSVISSQDDFHQAFRGVVPEIAARRHLETIIPVVEKALSDASVTPRDLGGIAVTSRPGLIGSLMVGLGTAQSLALAWDLPIVSVNHLAAHAYTLQLEGSWAYPHLVLLVSGGHTLLLHAKGPLDFDILGSTMDDACGEAFDKVAKGLGLPWPGGPAIDRLSTEGDGDAIHYPIAVLPGKDHRFDFSFSGLKTAVLHQTPQFARKPNPTPADVAASFQKTAIRTLLEKSKQAASAYSLTRIGIVGGVSANRELRRQVADERAFEWALPRPGLCTDNAAMVAGLGWHALRERPSVDADELRPLTRNARADKVV